MTKTHTTSHTNTNFTIVTAQDWDSLRQNAVAVLKPWLREERNHIKETFFANQLPEPTLKSLTEKTDDVINFLLACAIHHIKLINAPIAILALGGYGRKHLFPHSDIDILFLYTHENKKHAEDLSIFLLHCLWDIGFQVGQCLRTIDECFNEAKKDHTILTALLDARFICGDASLSQKLLQTTIPSLKSDIHVSKFISSKLEERSKRHEKSGDSRYILEPNIKENKGALRDLHTLFWIAHYAYDIKRIRDLTTQGKLTEQEYKIYRRARQFLWRLRIYLHFFTDKPEERLTFDMQRRIAEAMGYRGKNTNQSVERFMKHYFQVVRDVGTLTGIFCAILEEEQKRSPAMFTSGAQNTYNTEEFVLLGGRLHITDINIFEKNPELIIKFFHICCREHLIAHPRTLQTITRSLHFINTHTRHHTNAMQWFLAILMHPQRGYATLRTMNDTGVLGKLIPEFAQIVGQMQFDMYHIYTVDEHTLHAIGILHAIERRDVKHDLPLSSRIMPILRAKHVLYLAMFCHDIAKGLGGNHEIRGEIITQKIAKQCHFTSAEIELTGWLVRQQSLMSEIIFKRDLHDPATIHYCCKEIQSLERLRLLLVLTTADIKAVGPKVWNSWKGGLLRDLFHLCEEFISTGNIKNQSISISELHTNLSDFLPDWSKEDINAYIWRGHTAFFNSRNGYKHAIVAQLLKDAEQTNQSLITHFHHEPSLDFTELTVCSIDRKGLMADIAAAISLARQNIINASIFTLKDGWAVQTWHIQTPHQHALDPFSYDHIVHCIKEITNGNIHYSTIEKNYPKINKETFSIATHIFIDNEASNSHTIIEVTAADRIGLLHTICRTLQKEALNISSAHINTYGEKAVDVFYIRDTYGMKILHPKKLEHIQTALLYAISPTSVTSTFNYII